MSEGSRVAECIDFVMCKLCGAPFFLGQKGRLWVPFRLLVVGARMRFLFVSLHGKLFYASVPASALTSELTSVFDIQETLIECIGSHTLGRASPLLRCQLRQT